MKEVYIYDVTCPITGKKLYRVSTTKAVYTHAICAVKPNDNLISLHPNLEDAERIAKSLKRIRCGIKRGHSPFFTYQGILSL